MSNRVIEQNEAAAYMRKLEAALTRATRALTRAGWTYMAGAEEWRPPLGPSAEPLLDRIEKLEAALRLIDAFNDSPSIFNSDINNVCRSILGPELE